MPRVFRDANVCSAAIPLFEHALRCELGDPELGGRQGPHAGDNDNRVVARQLLPDVSFRSGGSAPIRQVHSDSQLSAGLDVLVSACRSPRPRLA